MRCSVEVLAKRTHTQSRRCGGGVELIVGCSFWALQSPESLLNPGPTKSEQKQKGRNTNVSQEKKITVQVSYFQVI